MFGQKKAFGSVVRSAILMSIFYQHTSALTCFETNDDGDMVEVTNDEWQYCVMLPERIENNKFVEGRAFGTGPSTDQMANFNQMFSSNDGMYQVLSLCVQERYDFGSISPKFAFKSPEFMLRCFCNYDLCNKEKNFFAFMDNVRDESAALDGKRAPKRAH